MTKEFEPDELILVVTRPLADGRRVRCDRCGARADHVAYLDVDAFDQASEMSMPRRAVKFEGRDCAKIYICARCWHEIPNRAVLQ